MIETKGRKTKMVDIMEFASLLRMNTAKVERMESRLHARIAGMGLGDVCGRCGGTGSYSYNQRDGSRCYGCNGNRTLLPKLSEAFYEKVKIEVLNGTLDAYLVKLAQREKVEKAEKMIHAYVAKTNIANDYEAEYRRSREEETIERRRVDAVCGGRALGKEFAEHYNPANVKEMNEYTKETRFAQSRIVKEYENLLFKLRKEKRYGMKINVPTPEDVAECEVILLAKYEDIMNRLIAQEAEYNANRPPLK